MSQRRVPTRTAVDRLVARLASFRLTKAMGGRHPPPEKADVHENAPARTSAVATQVRVAAPAADMTRWQEVKRLFQQCRRLLRECPDCLVVDLTDVERADTKLVSCLVRVYQLANAESVKIEMILPKSVEEILAVCRLEQLIEQTKPTEPEA